VYILPYSQGRGAGLGIRRVQKVGKSTFTVSLPHDWVKAKNLSPKTEVDVQPLQDGSLRVNTIDALKGEERAKEIVISIKEPDAGYLVRKALAAYIANYDVIRLDLSKVNLEASAKEKIRKMIKNKMAGGEIIEESVNQITIQILLRPTEFPLDKLLLRMATMAHDMMKDVGSAMRTKDKNVLQDVIARDEGVDKLYFMASRWLTNMVDDQSVLKGYGLTDARDCLEYRLACRNIERVADHVNRIVEKLLNSLDGVQEDLAESFASTLEMAGIVFIRSVNCLQSGSLQEANKAIHDARKAISNSEGLMVALMDSDMPVQIISNLVVAVDSIKRIAEYGIGISELVFNLYVE
jgi:phosphate uptake regulator